VALVALMKDRHVDSVRTLTADAAPKTFHVDERRIRRQTLNSKLVCESRWIDLKPAYHGLWEERAEPLCEFMECRSPLTRRHFGRMRLNGYQMLAIMLTIAALRVVLGLLE